ncbi:YgaP family membrane protein [Desulfuribacillus alkaliarsenatis]|uniref:YgaP family membrane protein n=1 Tax=Desulfuribacillus alkaliarsenatis TaxID=766136 RepID=UPI0009FBCE4D|nr:DUF2892 domain-containing protein [Desulfuribacillus alkaliarsenatis]
MRYNLDYKKNLGDTDRIIRFVLGVFLLALFYDRRIAGTKGFWLAIIGASQVVEGILGY